MHHHHHHHHHHDRRHRHHHRRHHRHGYDPSPIVIAGEKRRGGEKEWSEDNW